MRAEAVLIVTGEINPHEARIIVVDGHCSLAFALGFGVIHEFVNRSTPEIHQACRERFKAYRARQVEAEHLRG